MNLFAEVQTEAKENQANCKNILMYVVSIKNILNLFENEYNFFQKYLNKIILQKSNKFLKLLKIYSKNFK